MRTTRRSPRNSIQFAIFAVVPLLIIGGIAAYNNASAPSSSGTIPTTETATDPASLAKAVISKEGANVQVEVTEAVPGTPPGSALTVRYSLTPWPEDDRRGAFVRHIQDVVPEVFARFPDINQIMLAATSRVVDIRGHDHEASAMAMIFSRENAATINWKQFDLRNLTRIANTEWRDRLLRDR